MESENSKKIRHTIALVFLSIIAIILLLAAFFSTRNKSELKPEKQPETTQLTIDIQSKPEFL
jgi:Na+/melibiose symporter-like transporter